MKVDDSSTRFTRFATYVQLVLLILLVLAVSYGLMHADTPQPPAANPPASGGEDFGQYLSDHQDVIGPFFKNNSSALVKESLPYVM